MRRTFIIGALVLFVVLAAGGLWLLRGNERNRQFDAGLMALKEDRGQDGVRTLEPLARAGDRQAAGILGEVYALGTIAGVPKNDELAVRWLRAAGPHGRKPRPGEDPAADAEYWIGRGYAEGDGPYHKDRVESRKWLERAAKGGSREAAEMLNQQQK